MVYILMQPDNSPESLVEIIDLESTGECIFDYIHSGPRLIPVLVNYRANLNHERDYHSFDSEIACCHWAISRLFKYLWGKLFYWLYDYNEIKDIIEHNGSIHQLTQWNRDFLAYTFVNIARVATMNKAVDSVSRYIDPLVYQYTITTFRLHTEDIIIRRFAYTFDFFIRCHDPSHVIASDTLSNFIATSTILSLYTLYYNPMKLSTACKFCSIPIISHQDTECHLLSIPLTPHSKIT